jgi:hypothetical protein
MSPMLGLLVLLFPLLLLGFMLFMERVEEPLNKVTSERDIEQFLEDANRAELDSFVREGTDSALRRFRNRVRRLRLPSARRRPGVSPRAGPESGETAAPSGQSAAPSGQTAHSSAQTAAPSGQSAAPSEPT